MSSTSISPNWREILYARNSITGYSEYLTSTNHRLDVNATISGGITIASVDQGAGAAQGTSWRIKGDFMELTGLSAGSMNADLVPSTEVINFRSFSLQIQGTFSGTLTLQGSNDNLDWRSVGGVFSNSFATNMSATFAGQGIVIGPIEYRYMRVRMTAYTSGTATGLIEMLTTPFMPHTTGVNATSTQSGIWDFQTRITSNTPTVTAVASSGSNTTLKIANASRRGLCVFNGADKTLYLKMGTTASTTSYTVQILSGSYWEMPMFPVWQGQIDGIWDASPTGNALVTEIT